MHFSCNISLGYMATMGTLSLLRLVCLFVCYFAMIETGYARECVSSPQHNDIDHGYYVDKTIVQNAVSKGAVCLDGSPPAYYFAPGFGEGKENWFVLISGGAWCSTVKDCFNRSKSFMGSSNLMEPMLFKGIYSKSQSSNPDFYNWNKVHVSYCDGGAFTGDVESVDPVTKLHFRGARIFKAVMEDLLAKGLKNAKNAFLAGSSAGAYPAMLYCDDFHNLLPNTPRVKCFTDSGYFIHVKNHEQAKAFESIYKGLVDLHGSAKALPKACTSKMKPELCFFPENMQQYIKTPLFTLMSSFDVYQVETTIDHNIYGFIKNRTCSAIQKKKLREFRSEFLSTLPKPNDTKLRGAFIDSYHHHTRLQRFWSPRNVSVVNHVSASKAFADWYFDRKYYYVIDEHDLPIPVFYDDEGNIIKKG